MLGLRRIAVAATSFTYSAPVLRSRFNYARTARSALASSRSLQPSWSTLSQIRAYAATPEKPGEEVQQEASVTDSAWQAISEASESGKEAIKHTQESASEAASEATDHVKETAESAYESAANTAGSVAETAESGFREISRRQPGQPSTSLYIGNLYFEVSESALREELSRYGELVSAKIIYDGRGLSKGFGYVEFANEADAVRAKTTLDQQVFEGRRMTVQYAISKRPRDIPPMNEAGYRHPPSRTLYIGNLSYEMTDKDLNELFRQVKNVLDVRVAIDRKTGQPRGYAHADFLDVDSATKAAEHLKSQTFYGRTLRVDYTHSKTTQDSGR